MKKIKKLFTSLSFNIISFILLLLIIFSMIVSAIGLISFTRAFKREYSTSSFHVASTATALINPDNLNKYLEEGEDAEYLTSKDYLDRYCDKMHVSIVYVISVDTSDYGSFKSVFNSVNNEVGNTNYTPWPLGYTRDTTNDEYKEKYKALYEEGSEYEVIYRTTNLKGQIPHLTVMVPVKASSGEVVGILCLQRPISEITSARRPYLINIVISVIVISVLTGLLTITYLKNQFVKPMRKVAEEAMRFAKENSQGLKLEDISKIQEIANLGKSIDEMEEEMLNYIDNLEAVTKDKERIGVELSIATAIQENSIPHKFPAFPDRRDFDIYASMTPAKEVGGDFYNFFLVDSDHLAIVIADVSGKGIPAALFMMVTNILISDRTKMGGTPGEILTFVNDGICEHNEVDMFVTVWLGIIELSTGKVIASNAGHDDPFIYHKGAAFAMNKSKHGLVIGAFSGIKYQDYEFKLNPGDKIFLYTDGVTEATNSEKELFGFNRVLDSLNKYKDYSPQEILGGMQKSVDEFVGEAPQFDDLTMVSFELKENKEKELKIDAKNENLYQVMEFVDSFLEENECTMKAQTQIDLSVEEVFVNIASYAYPAKEGDCELKISMDGDNVIITFIDSGIKYNPLEKADPDNTLSASEREIGGLGIFLVKKNMDNVLYEYKDNKNILTLVKKIK